MVNWAMVTGVATILSTFAYIVTALYIRAELTALDKERYLTVTSELFSVWQSQEFMVSQFWLLHKMNDTTWQSFVESHRGDTGEIAFHRVGSFYDRVGTLVRLKMIDANEILSTIGPHAIAVWHKIEPLVIEARRIENSVLFDDFEALLPSCMECYVPTMGKKGKVNPFSLEQPVMMAAHSHDKSIELKPVIPKTTIQELKKMLGHEGEPVLLDVRQAGNITKDPRKLPGAIIIPPEDVEMRLSELPKDRHIVAYCACPNDGTSSAVAKLLNANGYKASALAKGYDAWVAAHYPLENIS